MFCIKIKSASCPIYVSVNQTICFHILCDIVKFKVGWVCSIFVEIHVYTTIIIFKWDTGKNGDAIFTICCYILVIYSMQVFHGCNEHKQV